MPKRGTRLHACEPHGRLHCGTRAPDIRSHPVFALILCLALNQQTVPPAAQPSTPAVEGKGSPTVTIPRIEASVTVDGRLDEDVWARAARLGGFSQYQPVDGRPAEERTDVLVWYSPTALHVGIIAYDREPGSIRATVADRDNLDRDDTVTVYLDTFNDRRRAFVFTVNPLGSQQDGVLSETGFNAGMMSGGMMSRRLDRQEPRLPVGLARPGHGRRLRGRGAHSVQEPALSGQRPAEVGPERAAQGAAHRLRGHVDRRAPRQLELPGPGRRHRRHPRHEARRRHRGAAVRHDGEQRHVAVESGTVRARRHRGQPGREPAVRVHEPVDRRHRQPGLQPGRVGRRPGDGERAVRPLLPREATVLPRRHRAVLDAEPAGLHAADRRAAGRRQAHRQVRAPERRLPHREGQGQRGRRAVQRRTGARRLRQELDHRRHLHRPQRRRPTSAAWPLSIRGSSSRSSTTCRASSASRGPGSRATGSMRRSGWRNSTGPAVRGDSTTS